MTKRQEFIKRLADDCAEQFEDDIKSGWFKTAEGRNSAFQFLTGEIIDAVYKAYGTVMKAYLEGDYGL